MFLFFRKLGLGFFVAFGLLAGSVSSMLHAEPLALHPENPRYLIFRGKPTVLVTSAEHYGLLCNRAMNVDAYLQELVSHGFNLTRVFAGAYREPPSAFNITNNTLAPTDADFLSPWLRTAKTHRDGSPIFDLSEWEPKYFERLHQVLQKASDRHIVVELCLFSPMYKPNIWDVNPMNVRNNINQVGDCGSQEVFTTKNNDLLDFQKELAEKLLETVAPFDNVYIEVCNEPYFGGVEMQWQNAIIETLATKRKELGVQHLISMNVANKTQSIASPHPEVSIYNFHYCHPPVAVSDNAHINAPIGENETGFRGTEDYLYRTEGWDFLVAGGALYNNLDYSFSTDHPSGTQEDYSSPGGGSEALRTQLGILKRTFDGLPIPHLKPQPAQFAVATGDLIVSAIGDDRDQFLIYAHVALPDKRKDQPDANFEQTIKDVSLTLQLPDGEFYIKSIDTRTGKFTKLQASSIDDQTITVSLPPFQTDIAVRCMRLVDGKVGVKKMVDD